MATPRIESVTTSRTVIYPEARCPFFQAIVDETGARLVARIVDTSATASVPVMTAREAYEAIGLLTVVAKRLEQMEQEALQGGSNPKRGGV